MTFEVWLRCGLGGVADFGANYAVAVEEKKHLGFRFRRICYCLRSRHCRRRLHICALATTIKGLSCGANGCELKELGRFLVIQSLVSIKMNDLLNVSLILHLNSYVIHSCYSSRVALYLQHVSFHSVLVLPIADRGDSLLSYL
ncbi:hypothetical protein L2E82_14898 [Cichorium intybus]|uniref:Uncharacterized protein n=1 Tax=Cichorium intybus TaxID=13427 RepID=A0ACB9F1P7_CICIN|nr:hypothetical protein L2E82_14898 [Cichorium intybus]